MPVRASVRSSKKKAETGQQTLDDRVLRALSHPLRQRILGVLDKHVASPSDIADELGEKIGDVGYHVRVLRDAGAVELVRTEQRRGAIKHFYRATMRPMLTDEQFARLPLSTRRRLFGETLDEIWQHVGAAAANEGFDDPRAHVSWTPFELDARGYDAMTRLLESTLQKAAEIHAASLARQAKHQETAGRRTELVIAHFDRVAPPSAKRASKAGRAAGRRGNRPPKT